MATETLASSSSSSGDPPPRDAWIEAYRRRKPLLDSPQPLVPISISRVNQFDAARLDAEMSAMLKEQLVKVFSMMKPGFMFQYEPELDAFLDFLIWRFSIWVDKPTPGNALMNLRYRDERTVPAGGKEGFFISPPAVRLQATDSRLSRLLALPPSASRQPPPDPLASRPPLSTYVKGAIRSVLKSYCNRYVVKEESGALYFGWEDKILVLASAWK